MGTNECTRENSTGSGGMAIRRWRWHSSDFVPYLPFLWQLINLFFLREGFIDGYGQFR